MSPRCKVLVRAANRRMTSLVISSEYGLENIKSSLDFAYLSSSPSMQALKDSGESFPDYPMTSTPLSKWNCLMLDNEIIIGAIGIEQIVDIFSAVTDLKLIIDDEQLFYVYIELLEHPQWTNQLTNLMVTNHAHLCPYSSLERPFIAAINRLTALQFLALMWFNSGKELPDMTILKQLKAIVFKCYGWTVPDFLDSLNQYAYENADLQVHLLTFIPKPLIGLKTPLRNRIFRCGDESSDLTIDHVPHLCLQLPSLISLSVRCTKPSHFRPMFTALSKLQQLTHLVLYAVLEVENQTEELRPLAQLTSVRALDLHLDITSHSPVQWLNLQRTLPNCQAIHVRSFHCDSCKISFCGRIEPGVDYEWVPNTPKALECLRASFLNLHSGVRLSRIFVGGNEPFSTFEQNYFSFQPVSSDSSASLSQ